MSSRVTLIPLIFLAATALGGIVGLASNPDYYAYALISIALCGVAWHMLQNPGNRRLLLGAFVALGTFAFIVGRMYFRDHRLDDNGVFLIILFGLLPVVIVSWCIFSGEREFLDKENGPLV